MSTKIGDTSDLRLKAVLDILAEATWSGQILGASAVLAEAQKRFPLDEREAELLSGGIPRGHKSLTSATAKLVKAGWLVKGRAGWTITEDGLRATVAFPDEASFTAALAEGTPVPADMPVPTGPVKSTAPAGEAPAATEAKTPRQPKAAVADAPAEETVAFPQPEAVAIAGDFGTKLGAPEDWAPQFDEVQMELEPATQVWQLTAELPAGFYTYKAALNRSWGENYGAFGVFDGANHELHHAGGTVTFRYDHRTRDVSIG